MGYGVVSTWGEKRCSDCAGGCGNDDDQESIKNRARMNDRDVVDDDGLLCSFIHSKQTDVSGFCFDAN